MHDYERINRLLRPQSSMVKQLQDLLDRSSIFSQAQKWADTFNNANRVAGGYESAQRLARLIGTDNASQRLALTLTPQLKHDSFRRYEKLFSQRSVIDQLVASEASIAQLRVARQTLFERSSSLRRTELSDLAIGESDVRAAEQAAEAVSKHLTKDATLQDTVQKMAEVVDAQPSLGVQLMLLVLFRKLIDWMIAGAIGAAMGHYAPLLLGESPREDKKIVNAAARELIGTPELLHSYRYVASKVLIVRLNPRASSPELGRLKFGAAVELVEKSGDFALVKWRDNATKVELQGWVFARYVSKFK
jgi:hypothetical protein